MDITNQGCATQDGGISAAQSALDAEINGYSDWYLPSSGELQTMYLSIGNGSYLGSIGDFLNNSYWSSSENSNANARFVYFYGGYPSGYGKNNSLRVRAVRAF
jgi:hypothetical protein